MSKVFTITEGLENMGALKSGGQGSVYKGRRVGEIKTAIKLLPTPVIGTSPQDKGYADFMNEVAKLKRVNEEPNPNVVAILSSGVSDTGNFPFIEMEYIEGPDLEELLHPPHDPVFTIKDACKVAEHLSNALAHCHKFGVTHGDIKSNNVKFNTSTGNYVLLDFGLSVMNDEQRRTSLRHAGAIEFMAPEQNEGQLLYESDVYGFGIIMFELLAGQVPFPLNDKTESARNRVRVSHIETPVPDLMELRRQRLPAGWSAEKQEHEMHVPHWLIDTIYKCLQKNPKDRFADGVALHDQIIHSRNVAVKGDDVLASQVAVLKKTNHDLSLQVQELQQKVNNYEQTLQAQQPEPTGLAYPAYAAPAVSKGKVSKSMFTLVLLLAIVFAAIATYSFFSRPSQPSIEDSYAVSSDSLDSEKATLAEEPIEQPARTMDDVNERVTERQEQPVATPTTDTAPVISTPGPVADTSARENTTPKEEEQKDKQSSLFKVSSKAYFHRMANEGSRTNEYIIPGNVVVRAIDEKGEFILVNFKDDQGSTTRGWIRKKDLNRLN